MNKFFECRYAMYLHHRGMKSSIHGENLIDAIKNRNQFAILVWVIDEDGTEYFVNEHDEPDEQGYYNYYWTDKNGNVLFDENSVEKIPPKPILIENTTTQSGWICPKGKFYECCFEGHSSLAREITDFGIEKNPKYMDPERRLEEAKWVKLSDGEIRFDARHMEIFSKKQKETIQDYYKDKPINVWGDRLSVKQLYEEY